MIAVDTNIVVRLLTQDDERQYNRSLKLFQEHDIFIPDTVILETRSDEICTALRNLLGLPNVQVSNGSLIVQTLQWHENGLDFADALHLAQSQNCSAMYTFDTKFVNRSQGLTECEVRQP